MKDRRHRTLSFFSFAYRDEFVERVFAVAGLAGLGIIVAGKIAGVL